MLNLLNREKRYFLRAEYLGRLLNLFLGIVIFSLVFYGVLLFSNSFLIGFEKKAVENESNNMTFASLQKDLKEYEEMLQHIEGEYSLFSKEIIYPIDFLSIINSKKIDGITVTGMNFQKVNDEGEVNLEVKGIANSRDILIAYSNSLKTEPLFKEVTIPISSLARNINIPFVISISAKIETPNEN